MISFRSSASGARARARARAPSRRRARSLAHDGVASALTALFGAVTAVACGGSAPPPASPAAASPDSGVASADTDFVAAPTAVGPSRAADAGPPRSLAAPLPELTSDPKALVDRMRGGLTGCYENGKKAAQEMADGHVVLNIAVSEAGKATCVVPSDATGLTREVTECMSARAEREPYPTGAPLAIALPIAVTAGAVDLQPEAKGPVLEKIESEGVAGAGATIQKMLPELRACVREGLGQSASGAPMKGVVYANAKLGKKGEIVCAVATRGDVPPEVRACVSGKLSKAKFAAPKWGAATISIPLKVVAATDRK